jgi:hypothetical protein
MLLPLHNNLVPVVRQPRSLSNLTMIMKQRKAEQPEVFREIKFKNK